MNNPRPIQFKIAISLATAESLAAVALTLFFLWGFATGQVLVWTALVFEIALFAATAAFLTAATIALSKLKRWGRSAIIFWQLIQISLGYGTMEGKDANYLLAILIFAVSGATFVMLLTKPVNELFKED